MIFDLWRRFRRKRLLREPFPPAWTALVADRLAYATQYTGEERERFLEHLLLFAREKHFEGVGIDVTDEMRVVISGAAARLSKNVTYDVYNALDRIVIYPSTFWSTQKTAGKTGYDEGESQVARLGEASAHGVVVLSWDAVKRGLKNPHDGRDTALHEFAHIIDAEDGAFDGAPFLDRKEDQQAWYKAFSAHYAKIQEHPHGDVVRPYGATNPAEFFACATEVFFEKPKVLRRKAPDLYDALVTLYKADPATQGRRVKRGRRRR